MTNVIVVCEGLTEEKFIREVIAPILRSQQIYIKPQGIQTSPGHTGGALTYERVRRHINISLKQDKQTIITTFFDLYKLNNKFPGFSEIQEMSDVYQKVAHLEQKLKQAITQDNYSFSKRFLPHIQPYEFEGLLFTDIKKLIEIETYWQGSLKTLEAVRTSYPSPEHINDGFETKPSARLENILARPNYDKLLHGTLAIQSIGIDKLCLECKHFAEWYTSLSQLGNA